jgi:hypothetical protein
MQMLLEYTQLECGCRGNPLAQDYNKYSSLLINTNYITEVWEHLQTCKAKVEIDGVWQPTENRVHDIVIMKTLIASCRFTNKDLKEINYCCIYLQAFYLSDIIHIKGNKIEAWVGRGHKQDRRQSTWEWPVQQRPIAWKAWKEALEYLAPDGDIGEPLGEWKSDHNQIMEWYFDAQISALFHHIEGLWTRHDAMNIGILRFRPEAHSCEEPNLYTHVNEKEILTVDRALYGRYASFITKSRLKKGTLIFFSKLHACSSLVICTLSNGVLSCSYTEYASAPKK